MSEHNVNEEWLKIIAGTQIIDLGDYDVPKWLDMVTWIGLGLLIFLAGFAAGMEW